MTAPRQTSTSQGFSLIELLVVVSIIAILAGMLLPAVGLVRQKAKGAVCGSNLRQCAMAAMGYMADHDNVYPMASDPTLGIWHAELGPYFSKDDSVSDNRTTYCKATICPAYTLPSGSWMDNGQTGLGMNDKLRIEQTWDSSYCWGWWDYYNTSFPATKVSLPASRILFGDSGYAMLSPTNIGGWIWANAANTAAGSPGNWNWTSDPTRHGTTSNYAFCDGHVQALDPARSILGVSDPAKL